jgi:hypothetical protein
MSIDTFQFNRRLFLGGGVAGFGFLSSAGAAAPAGRVSKMRFGLATYQWGRDWDIPTLIANCTRAKALGVEPRTSAKHAHGIELEMGDAARREVKKRFADSPVTLVGLASGERFDSPDPAKLKESIENAKAFMKLSQDVGGRGVRVFVNDFHKEVPEEKTLAQVARALDEVGRYAAGLGQTVRLENHGSAGRLVTLRKILDQVKQANIRIKLNCDVRDNEGGAFARNFALVKDRLDDTLHFHELDDAKFPFQLQTDLLVDMGWNGWWLAEMSTTPPDRVQALIEQRELWEKLIARSLGRA